jgi:hypothetical protein
VDTTGGDQVTDPETAAAVGALASRVRSRDGDPDRADAEVFALEFMTALRARGWRPTPARAIPAWKPSPGPRSKPPAGMLRELRADLDAKAAAFRAAGDGAA